MVISQTLFDPFIDDKKLIISLNDTLASRSFEDYKYGGNPFGAWRFREIMERRIMGDPTLYRFEDMEIFGAENADEYLTHLYGDWRKLPPPEKQVSHHVFSELDLNQSYLH